jgi:transcription initiation factor TFIID subunit 13
MLIAFGAPMPPSHISPTLAAEPYPETLRVLDEILTDFIIETCHAAAAVASYANRQKLKTSDFEFVLRKDKHKLGHVQSMFEKKRVLDRDRKGADFEGLGGGRMGVGDLEVLAEGAGEKGTAKGVGRGRGKRRKKAEIDREKDREAAGGGGGDEGERPTKKARSDKGG